MSGIAAILNLDGSAVSRSEVERMARALKPYGPDRQKTLMRGNAAFVFCLHELTPEDRFERQPLLLANRFVILFDGRIDNRIVVRPMRNRLVVSSKDVLVNAKLLIKEFEG